MRRDGGPEVNDAAEAISWLLITGAKSVVRGSRATSLIMLPEEKAMKRVSIAACFGIALGMMLSLTTAGYPQAPCQSLDEVTRVLPLPHRGASKRSRRRHQKR